MKWGSHEFDDCRRVDKRPGRLLTEDIDIRYEWPALYDIGVAQSFDDIGRMGSKEQSGARCRPTGV